MHVTKSEYRANLHVSSFFLPKPFDRLITYIDNRELFYKIFAPMQDLAPHQSILARLRVDDFSRV